MLWPKTVAVVGAGPAGLAAAYYLGQAIRASLETETLLGRAEQALRAYLAAHGIETRTFFIPMHLQPIYYQAFKGQHYPVSEMLCQRGFYLPSASSLEAQEIDYIVDIVRQAHQEAAGSR